MLKIVVALLFLLIVNTKWTRNYHDYSPNVSSALSNAIKDKLYLSKYFRLGNLEYFTNVDFRLQFKSDLLEPNDSKRKLKSIDSLSASQLFTILKIKDPGCDANNDKVIEGDELKCLNIIWKSYVPPN